MKIISEFGSAGKKYLKKPIPIEAKQLPFAFEVQTMEGIMQGKANDYLVKGVKGELYPCDKEIFEETYEEVVA